MPLVYVVIICGFAALVGSAALMPTPSQPATPEATILFDKSVASLLETSCVQCHGGKHKESGFDMTTREGLLKGGDWGPGAVPGKAVESQMVVLVKHEEEPFMPEDKPKLSDAEIAMLVAWIDGGAPYTRTLRARPTKK